MTSHSSPDPVTLNPLGLDNGLVQPRFRAPCTGPPTVTQYATVLCSGCVSLCYMLAFIRDPFVTSYKWPDPVTRNALGLDNGLAPSRFRTLCTGPLHTVHHGAGVM